MNQKTKERLGGLLNILLCGPALVWMWSNAVTKHYFYPKLVGILTAFFIVGVFLLIFGGYRSERLENGEDISKLSGLKLLTPRWWMVLIISIIGAIITVILFYRAINS